MNDEGWAQDQVEGTDRWDCVGCHASDKRTLTLTKDDGEKGIEDIRLGPAGDLLQAPLQRLHSRMKGHQRCKCTQLHMMKLAEVLWVCECVFVCIVQEWNPGAWGGEWCGLIGEIWKMLNHSKRKLVVFEVIVNTHLFTQSSTVIVFITAQTTATGEWRIYHMTRIFCVQFALQQEAIHNSESSFWISCQLTFVSSIHFTGCS